MNKIVIWTLVSVAVVGATLFGLKSAGVIWKDEGLKVATDKAKLLTITETVNASGKIYPEIEVKVSPDISGEVVELNVSEGDTVHKGQVLAKIYADIYATQRDQVAAGVAQARAQTSYSSAGLNGLKAMADQAETNLKRQQKLLVDRVISQSEFDQAKQAFLSAESNYQAALEGIKSNSAQELGAKAQLAKAEKDLSRTVITAPMDGVISLLGIKKGERVAGNSFNVGTEMMRIADMRSLETRVDVGENDIVKVKIGDTALIEVDAYNNRKFKGLVYKIANPNTGLTTSSNDVTNYKVHIRLLPSSYQDLVVPHKYFPFRPNMSASAEIQTKTEHNVLAVPINGVTTRTLKKDSSEAKKGDDKEGKGVNNIEEVVFVVQKDGKVKKVKVVTGIQDINNIQILDGLKVADEIVTAPFSLVGKTLKDGDKVKVVEKESLFEEEKK